MGKLARRRFSASYRSILSFVHCGTPPSTHFNSSGFLKIKRRSVNYPDVCGLMFRTHESDPVVRARRSGPCPDPRQPQETQDGNKQNDPVKPHFARRYLWRPKAVEIWDLVYISRKEEWTPLETLRALLRARRYSPHAS